MAYAVSAIAPGEVRQIVSWPVYCEYRIGEQPIKNEQTRRTMLPFRVFILFRLPCSYESRLANFCEGLFPQQELQDFAGSCSLFLPSFPCPHEQGALAQRWTAR